jgi:hypothetical protein
VHRLRPERREGVRQYLQPCSRGTAPKGQKKDGVGAVGDGGVECWQEVDTVSVVQPRSALRWLGNNRFPWILEPRGTRR